MLGQIVMSKGYLSICTVMLKFYETGGDMTKLKLVSTGTPTLTQQRLDFIIGKHYMWLDSDGDEGEPADFSSYDISGLNLSGMNLCWSKFVNTKMNSTKFIGTQMYQCILINCDARGVVMTEKTDLRSSEIKRVNFRYSDLRTAEFSESSITDCDFTVSHLASTDFRFCRIKNTQFADTSESDFRGVRYV